MPFVFGSLAAKEVLERDKEIFGEWRLKEIPKGEYITCPECDGKGMIEEDCSECGQPYENECGYCEGTGEAKLEEIIMDKIRKEKIRDKLRKS